MDNLIREGEQTLESQTGGSGQGNMGGGNNDDQGGGGNMGGGNESGGNMGGGNMDQQSGGGQSSGSGGGFLGGLQKTGENAMVDQEVNQFATKEGLPAGADGVIDQFVNKEV